MKATSPESKVTPDAADRLRSRTMAYATAGIGVLALFVVFRDTAFSFIPIWETDSFGHGYLIGPISIFLFWLCRFRIAQAPVRPSLFGLAAIAGLSAVWALGEIADVNLVRQAAFVGLIQAMILAVLGWRIFHAAMFPVGYLLFAVPFGEFLIPPLQDLTAWFAVGSLNVLGVPTFSDGIYIQTPSGNYLVAEACSGSRYLLSTLAVSMLAAGMLFRSWHKRLLFIAAGIVVSIIANAMRATGVILLAHWVDPSLAGPEHITYGLVFVAIITLIYLMIGSSFRERSIGEYADEGRDAIVRPTVTVSGTLPVVAMAGVALALMASTNVYVGFVLAEKSFPTVAAPMPPTAQVPWRLATSEAGGWHPLYKGVSAQLLQRYENGKRGVDLYIGVYASQKPDAELINRSNSIEGETWGRAGSGTRETRIEGRPLTVNYVRLLPQRYLGNSTEATGRLAWYWYWVGDEFTANPYIAKLLEVKTILFGQSRVSAVIAVAADYKDEPAEAIDALRDFLQHLDPLVPGLMQALQRQPGDHGS